MESHPGPTSLSCSPPGTHHHSSSRPNQEPRTRKESCDKEQGAAKKRVSRQDQPSRQDQERRRLVARGLGTNDSEQDEKLTSTKKEDVTISEALNILELNLEELDVDDVKRLSHVLLSFEWPSEVRTLMKNRVEIKKKPPGPGRGKTKEKEKAESLDQSVKLIIENWDYVAKENQAVLFNRALSTISLDNLVKLLEAERGDKKEKLSEALGRSINSKLQNSSKATPIKSLQDLLSTSPETLAMQVHPVISKFVLGTITGNKILGEGQGAAARWQESQRKEVRSRSRRQEGADRIGGKFTSIKDNEAEGQVVANSRQEIQGKETKRQEAIRSREKQISIVTVEINDRLLKLSNPRYLSTLGVSRNYAILKASGSKQTVNILGRTDGSGKYNLLKKIEQESAKKKEVSVFPADVDICADNEQVLSKNYRIAGSESERKLPCNVINNWQASYFCSKEDINKKGIQSDPSLLPNWLG